MKMYNIDKEPILRERPVFESFNNMGQYLSQPRDWLARVTVRSFGASVVKKEPSSISTSIFYAREGGQGASS